MSNPLSMAEIALTLKEFDEELREALLTSRSGIFRKSNGDLYLRKDVPLGQRYAEEAVGIFADQADLDFFYKLYLKND